MTRRSKADPRIERIAEALQWYGVCVHTKSIADAKEAYRSVMREVRAFERAVLREARRTEIWRAMRPDGRLVHRFQTEAEARAWIEKTIGTGRGWVAVRAAIESRRKP